jgi:hypothetical protein
MGFHLSLALKRCGYLWVRLSLALTRCRYLWVRLSLALTRCRYLWVRLSLALTRCGYLWVRLSLVFASCGCLCVRPSLNYSACRVARFSWTWCERTNIEEQENFFSSIVLPCLSCELPMWEPLRKTSDKILCCIFIEWLRIHQLFLRV